MFLRLARPDEAVFLPGRNALLTIKAALWCQMHGINELAVATLARIHLRMRVLRFSPNWEKC